MGKLDWEIVARKLNRTVPSCAAHLYTAKENNVSWLRWKVSSEESGDNEEDEGVEMEDVHIPPLNKEKRKAKKRGREEMEEEVISRESSSSSMDTAMKYWGKQESKK